MNIAYIIDILYKPVINNLTVQDILSLLYVNKDIFKLLITRGFVRKIIYSYYHKYCDFIQNFQKHQNSIETIVLDSIIDPFLWIPLHKKKLILYDCHFLNNNAKFFNIFSNLRILKLDKCLNKYGEIINWKLLPNLEVLDIQYLTNNLSTKGINTCKSLYIFCVNNKNLDIDLNDFIGLNKLEYIITNCYFEPGITLDIPCLKYFIGDVQNIIIKNNQLEYINIGNEINSSIIKYDDSQIQLYDVTRVFENYNYKLRSKRLMNGYCKYFTQTIY